MIKDKYNYLLSLKLLEFEIKELTQYCKQDRECFELLKVRLDSLCTFIISRENRHRWAEWGEDADIVEHAEKVREASVQALCDMEKYQARCTCEQELDISNYMDIVSCTVQDEIRQHAINRHSKVLFIGAGAFPVSAMLIARETKAQVTCLDIDEEAVEWAQRVTEASGLAEYVTFTNKQSRQLAFTREASHIILASLVYNKYEVLEELRHCMNPNAKIILRYGNGLKSIFNYPLESDLAAKWVLKEVHNLNENSLYDTIVLERR